MSIIHVEGFDSISPGDLGAAGYYTFGNISSFGGRFGGSAFGTTSSSADMAIELAGQSIANGCTGVAVKLNSAPIVNNGRAIMVRNASGYVYLGVSDETGTLRFVVSGGGGGSYAGNQVVIPIGPWNYLELSWTGTGAWIARLNGKVYATGTSTALQSPATGVGLGNPVGGSNISTPFTFDDWYVKDDTNFLGDSVVVTREPTADSAAVWTPSGTGGNFEQVNEAAPNGDVDYVSSSTPGDQDLYTSSVAIPGNPTTIHAVATRMFSRKDDAAFREVLTRIRSGVATADGPVQALSTSYLGQSAIFELDPETGAAWTKDAVLASAFGPRLVT